MNQEKIGAFIRDIRKESGLTQEQLAEALGVSQRSISRWETGKTMPDYSLLPNICEVLGITVAELLEAERIEGDSVSKKQVSIMAQNMVSLVESKKMIRNIVGAILSVVITVVCVVGLYSHEFNVSVESTADLEQAINEYHFNDEVSVDILERQAVGNRLYVLYGENEYPGACGLACLEKGIFGNYRLISCHDSNYRWVNATTITAGGKTYCVTYCVNDLPEIDSYGICGVKYESGKNQTIDDSELICKIDYHGSPFLNFTEIADDVKIAPFHMKYYRDSAEIPVADLTTVLGDYSVDGAPSSSYGTAELGLIYVLEGIIVLVGIVFTRYFLTDIQREKKK